MAQANKVQFIVEAIDKASAQMKKINQSIADTSSKAQKDFGAIAQSSRNAGIAMAGFAAAGVASLTGILKKAAEMETFGKQFEVLLGDTEQAQQRLDELAKFGATTPFELPGIVRSSIVLETLTKGALATGEGLRMVGDVAAGTGQPMNELAVHFGRAYDAMQSGRPFGESAMRLQELGALTGDTRGKLEQMTKDGASFAEMWAVFTGDMGRFDGMMQQMNKTLSGQFSNLQDNIGLLAAEIGTELIPIMTKLTQAVSGVLEWFRELSPETKKVIAITLLAVTAFTLIAAPLLLLIGMIPTLVTGFSMLAAGIAFLFSPIGIVIALVTGLFLAWSNNFLGIRDITYSVLNAVSAFIIKIFTFIFNTAKIILKALFDFYFEKWRLMYEFTKNIIESIANFFSGGGKDKIVEGFTNMFSSLGGIAKSIFSGIVGIITGFVNKVISAINAIITAVNKVPGVSFGLISQIGVPKFAHGGMVGKDEKSGKGFADGGVVRGTGGTDTIPAALTAGEIVLNAAQQQRLASNLNGNNGSTINITITGNNFNGADEEMAEKLGDMIMRNLKQHSSVPLF